MDLSLDYTNKSLKKTGIIISGSKSESNRLLILQKLFPNLVLENLSDSDDTIHLKDALTSESDTVNIGHAGTAMRFLTAYFASKPDSHIVLTGSSRMQERPIQILVNALRDLGASINYANNDGFPPLKITGKTLEKQKVKMKGNVSSQYISALLLIAPSLENGLEIELEGEITSAPYLQMTVTLLEKLGVKVDWKGQSIKVYPKNNIDNCTITVESDWSSASYFYSLVALSQNGELNLSAYFKESLQGDSRLVEIYRAFGVETTYQENGITLKKIKDFDLQPISLNLIEQPDIAQTIAVTCFGLGIACDLTGLHTLKIKETDRLEALKNELSKLGAEIFVTDKSLHLKASPQMNADVLIKTYNDHRMAMAFAPLAIKIPIQIQDAEVVSKSYKHFWRDLDSVFT
ncbi:3-phosphoshikimate 1-carboxyvinyltransferase [Namhaeicola litoreus]|uniref:3-phosphoshikimate 1-carboxyvinyltransferase n=1 Tax=Namhaeicola litoreus TaxID=1052145 RepID=A0ABW3XXE6_9FLAO